MANRTPKKGTRRTAEKDSAKSLRKPKSRPVARVGSRPGVVRSENTALQENDLYRQIIDSIGDYEIILLDTEGRVVTWNKGAERLKGYRADEVLGQNHAMFYPPEDVRAGKPELELRQVATQGRIEGESRRMRKDGSTVVISAVVTALRDQRGKLVGYSRIGRDLNEARIEAARKQKIVDTVRDAAARLSGSVAEILATTTQQATGARQQSAAVTQTVSAVDEVLQSAEQAAQRARSMSDLGQRSLDAGRSGRRAVDETSAALETVKEQVEVLAESILSLAEQAQAIGEIIASVNDIAEQTNLLALNAAIEASRAGEHGRGFSVVASEIKTLADQSKKATTQVRQILGDIQKATNSAVMATEDGTKSVNATIKLMGQAGDTIRTLSDALEKSSQSADQIAAAANQQTIGMSQIHQAMKNIDQVTTQSIAATRQVDNAVQDLNQAGVRLKELMNTLS